MNEMTQATQTEVLKIAASTSTLTVVLPDGRSEEMSLASTCPTEFTVAEPYVEADGTTVVNIEILKFSVAGTSAQLWPGQTVAMSGGRNNGPEALPIHGTVRVPAGKSLADGAYSEQLVYLQVDSPLGRLHTVEPARMGAVINSIPPAGTFQSLTTGTKLYDNQGMSVLEIVACQSVTPL